MGILLRFSALSLVLITPLACGDDDDSKPATTKPPLATRSEACTAFQDAACGRAERCGSLTGPDCFASIRTTFCKSDTEAEACAGELESSTCTEVVPCAEAVLDPQPAIDICNEFADVFCDWAVRCDSTVTVEDCRAQFLERVDCTKAVGIDGDHEACFAAVESSECSEKPTLPKACESIIKLGS